MLTHYYLLLAHWPSLCYSTIFYWPTGSLYGTLPTFPSPVAPCATYVTLPFSTGPLAVSMVHYCLLLLLLANWLSLWYTTIFYWPNGYLYGTQLSSTGPLALSGVLYYLLLAISMVHYYLLVSHWLYLWYTTIFYWSTGFIYDTQLYLLTRYPRLLAHWISLWYTTPSC